MLTINAEIKKDGLRSNGTYNVKLRFTLDRKMRRLATSLFVTSKDLTKELKIKQNSPIKKEVDSLIRSYQEKCTKLQVELNHYTIDEVMDYLDGEHQKQQTIDFIKFSREWIASTTIKGAPNYTTAINALVRFIGKEELDVNLITTIFLENFKVFLNKEREVRMKKLILFSLVLLIVFQVSALDVSVPSSSRSGVSIPAYLTLPADYDDSLSYPFVIMLHGHGGNHNEFGGYDPISDGLAENGYVVATLDFSGCGASTESFKLNTMTNMIIISIVRG